MSAISISLTFCPNEPSDDVSVEVLVRCRLMAWEWLEKLSCRRIRLAHIIAIPHHHAHDTRALAARRGALSRGARA